MAVAGWGSLGEQFTDALLLDAIPVDWQFGFTIPANRPGLSKNRKFAVAANSGRIITSRESRETEYEIMLACKDAANAAGVVLPLPTRKIWLALMVEKTTPRSDAINVIDLVCDGVKKAIEVDDRWFALWRVDWRIVHPDTEPQLRGIIGLSRPENRI